MLIFDSEVLTRESTELELAERKSIRMKRIMGTIFGVGAAGVFGGIAGALFNGLVPFFGMLLGVHDTWGRPELIGPQFLFSLGTFFLMFAAVTIVGPHWDRAEAELNRLRAEENRLERFAAVEAVESSFECKSKRHRDFSEYPYERCRHC